MSGRILLLLPVIAFLNLGVNTDYRNASLTEIQTLFDALLKIEGMELEIDDYEERVRMFAANYQTGQSDEGISIQLMYNGEELVQQLGAKPVRGIEPQLTRNKRGIDPLRVSSTPKYFDGRKYRGKTIINEAVHQGICGNCYLHTFIAALELAYFKGSGELIKFSEQEMTDCYNNGCEGGDFKMVSVTMSYIDKVSTRAGYGEFLSKQVTCRANTTPDALKKIKVVDFIDITADTVEAAILKYGSVMTCMKWGSKPSDPCYMTNYRAGATVNYPEIKKGCDHAVLIVGYTPDYYIVRNSHGKTWGEDGYFRIKRNINSCGIEEDMAAVVIEGRHMKKTIAPNGCPLDRPYLCEDIYTCTAQTECTTAMDDLQKEEEEEEEEEGPAALINSGASSMQRPGIPSSSSSRSSSSSSGSRPGIPSSSSSRSSSSSSGSRPGIPSRGSMSSSGGSKSGAISAADAMRMQQQIAMSRGRSGLPRRNKKRHNIQKAKKTRSRSKRAACADRLGAAKCAALINRGADVCGGFYLPMCLGTCDQCEKAVVKEKKGVEKVGECIHPYIPYGKVLNKNKIMKANEELKVECESGYTLVGTTNKCLIQDIFTNDDKDARLLPECIKLGEDVLIGDGSTYKGTKKSYNYHGRWFECDGWNYDVFRGVLMGEKKAMEFLLGNHNYCRNPGGIEPVPFCIGSARGLGEIVYCFEHPGCDTCKGAVNKYEASYCEAQKRSCKYGDRTTKVRVSFMLDVCQATCCAENQCSTT